MLLGRQLQKTAQTLPPRCASKFLNQLQNVLMDNPSIIAYLVSTGATFPAFSAAMFASFCSLSARTWRKYLNKRINCSSILHASLVYRVMYWTT